MSHELDSAWFAGFVADIVARRCRWTPSGKVVDLFINCVEGAGPTEVHTGTVRAYDPKAGTVLIVLSERLKVSDKRSTDILVATPLRRWHRSRRLLVSSIAVRFVEATSFRDVLESPTIGSGWLALQMCGTTSVKRDKLS